MKRPESYRATFLLGSQKVRGVDFHPVGQRRWYKERIPPGWHQDMRDPNLPTTDANHHRRVPLPDFAPLDFRDFIGRTAALWSIDLAWEESMV